MDRKHKPAAIPTTPTLAQPTVHMADNAVTASLPSKSDSVTINLYGATVTSWTTSPHGTEQLFLSTAAKLDGSKPIRGGIPLVFPVFGAPPKDHATKALPQHGFARNNFWEFLGSSSSESLGGKQDESIKLDFGLSGSQLDDATKAKWPYPFGLVFSVTLGKGTLETRMQVQNPGEQSFEFQCLFHSYFRIKDISQTTVEGLKGSSYVDKVRKAQTFTEESSQLAITSETDRVYTTPAADGQYGAIKIVESGKPTLSVKRDALPNVTVWNLWDEKAKAMGDFEPKDGWKQFVAIEPGAVGEWIKLEAGETWEGSQILQASLS